MEQKIAERLKDVITLCRFTGNKDVAYIIMEMVAFCNFHKVRTPTNLKDTLRKLAKETRKDERQDEERDPDNTTDAE